MYQTLFGPVPSRRLGISLGIDLVPMKTCSLNCVYCECGRTTKLTLERKEWVPTAKVTAELEDYLQNNPTPDFITFSGSGEPTLHSGVGDILEFLNEKKKQFPFKTAVLTNGTLFYLPEVRQSLLTADVVVPSLDAATEPVFKKINRPHPALNIQQVIEGEIAFRREYSGEIWLEVFIVPGLNDTPRELSALKEAILEIKADRIQLNTLDRPGAIPTIRAAKREELQKILNFWQLPNAEIIARSETRVEKKSYRKDTETAILETIRRRPCTLNDLQEILGLHVNEINKYLDVLQGKGLIEVVAQERGFFYRKAKPKEKRQ